MARLAAFLLAFVLSFAAAAQEKYAVLSLIGDRLLVVEREMSTGSRLDRNKRTYLPMGGSMRVDAEALFAAEDAIKRAKPGASVVLLGAKDPALYAAQAEFLDRGDGVQKLLPVVRKAVSGTGATRLVLIVKHRDDARLRIEGGHIGAGKLEGLGFYLDPSTGLENREKREVARGFIAPFAYFRVALIDLASGRVLGEERAIASTTVGSLDALAPWQAMSAEEKDRVLGTLVRSEIQELVPRLLGR